MPKPLMLVIMSVRLTRRIGAAVLMLMMFVMDMGMSVRDWLMDVFVLGDAPSGAAKLQMP